MGVSVREKRPGGGWWAFVCHHGRRKSKYIGHDKRAAHHFARELRQALAAGDWGLLHDEQTALTFGAYTEQYLKRMQPELKRSTWRDYDGCLRRRMIPALGPRRLTELRRRDIKEFAANLGQAGLSGINVRKHVRILSSVLSEAVEDELIGANPAIEFRKLRRSKRVAQRKRVTPLTADEVRSLLETATTHAVTRGQTTVHPFRPCYPFLLLLARTGMRLGEAIALKWGDVDWRGKFVEVQRAYVSGEVSVTKSGKARRVDLSAQLYATLREIFTDRFRRVVVLDPERQATHAADVATDAHDAWIFPSEHGGLLDGDNFRRRIWAPLLVAAKSRHCRLHDLRHTYASLLLGAGVDLKYVQEQLGHHSAAFTLSTYAHLLPADRHGLVNQLDTMAPARTPVAPCGSGGPGEAMAESAQRPSIVGGK